MDADVLLRLLEGSGSGLRIGQRVRLRRNPKVIGTVQHAGAVHFAVGDYVGVELGKSLYWDDGSP